MAPIYLTLNNGHKIPQLALGTFEIPSEVIEGAIETAISTGYRHIDCAMFYGNEKEIGVALKKSIEKHNLRREDLFITSKLWCDRHDPKVVFCTCDESVKDLGVGYLDLYLIHWPVSFQVREGKEFDFNDPSVLVYEDIKLEDTWKAMEELVDEKLTKSIGISNFNKSQIDRIMNVARIKPAVNEIEVNIHWQNTELVEYCQSLGITVMGYSPFGSPGFIKNQKKSVFEEPNVVAIANKYEKLPAQVILRYIIQRKVVPIVKSATLERIISNFNVFDFELTDEDMELLKKTGTNQRIFEIPSMAGHPEYPFK